MVDTEIEIFESNLENNKDGSCKPICLITAEQ